MIDGTGRQPGHRPLRPRLVPVVYGTTPARYVTFDHHRLRSNCPRRMPLNPSHSIGKTLRHGLLSFRSCGTLREARSRKVRELPIGQASGRCIQRQKRRDCGLNARDRSTLRSTVSVQHEVFNSISTPGLMVLSRQQMPARSAHLAVTNGSIQAAKTTRRRSYTRILSADRLT